MICTHYITVEVQQKQLELFHSTYLKRKSFVIAGLSKWRQYTSQILVSIQDNKE